MPSLRLDALVWQAHDAPRYRLDLRLGAGEMAVVTLDDPVGTALADVLLGLARPLGGAIHRDGRDVTGRPAGDRGIALVPAGGGLLPHLTVEQNVAFGGDRAHARDRVADLYLQDIRRLRPHELSPGQRLLVAVARALCHRREPVAIVVEDRAGQEPYEAAVETARAYGAAVLVITDVPGAATVAAVRLPDPPWPAVPPRPEPRSGGRGTGDPATPEMRKEAGDAT